MTIKTYFQHASISSPTLLKYIHQLTSLDEQISETFQTKLAIIFGVWRERDTHFLSLLASYFSCSDLVYDTVLLGLTPMKNADSLNANENMESITLLSYQYFQKK